MSVLKSKKQNLKDIEFYAHMNNAISLIKKWRELSPANEELKLMSESLVGIFFWCNTMEQEARIHEDIVSQYRDKKNRAIFKLKQIENG